MQINITCRGTEVTPPIRDYAQEKIVKLEEFFSNIQKVEVVLEARDIDDAERAQFAEIRAWMAGFKMIQATAEARDVYAAIDLVIEEAKRQIQKHKEKHVKESRRKASKMKRDIKASIAPETPAP
jgi:putative sigma-54 modulation protein